MVTELAQKFADYKIPAEFQRNFTNNFIKTMLFARENNITNDDIDYYMSIPPQRQEGETYEEMKARNRFSKALLKHRSKLYDYSVYEKTN